MALKEKISEQKLDDILAEARRFFDPFCYRDRQESFSVQFVICRTL